MSEQTYHPTWCKNSKDRLVTNIPHYCETRCFSFLSMESLEKSDAKGKTNLITINF